MAVHKTRSMRTDETSTHINTMDNTRILFKIRIYKSVGRRSLGNLEAVGYRKRHALISEAEKENYIYSRKIPVRRMHLQIRILMISFYIWVTFV